MPSSEPHPPLLKSLSTPSTLPAQQSPLPPCTASTCLPHRDQTPSPSLRRAFTERRPVTQDTPGSCYATKLYGQFDMSVNIDTGKCTIMGCCILRDGAVLLTDCTNNRLKRVAASYRVTGSYKISDHVYLPSGPHSVCSTGPDEAVITLPRCKAVQFVNLRRVPMALTRSFRVGERCQGIAHHKGKLFVIVGGGGTGEGPGELRIYTTSGVLTHRIQKDGRNRNLFSCPYSIVLNSDGSRCYIADQHKGLVILSSAGHLLSTTNVDMRYTYGVCRGEGEELLVCGRDPNNVVQVSGSGRRMGVVLTRNELSNIPLSVLYDHVTKRIVVTHHCANHISVFSLHER